jgi:hypothetical protein
MVGIVTSITNEDIRLAYLEGREARELKQPKSSNPYLDGPEKSSTLAGSWNNGWHSTDRP